MRSAFLWGLIMWAAQSASVASADTEQFAIGVIAPFSGSAADQGQWVRQGVLIAVDSTAGKVPISVHFEDSRADAKTAISAYRRLRSEFSVQAIISYGSGVGVSLTPLVNADKVIQIGVATATPAYRTAHDFTFRNFPSAELEAAFLAQSTEKLISLDAGVGLVSIDNEYGLGTGKAVEQALTKRGVKLSVHETIEPAGHDYRSTVLRLKNKSPDIIILAVYPSEGALFLKQARESGLRSRFIASTAIIGTNNFLALAAGAAEKLLVATSAPAYLIAQTKAGDDFKSGYQKLFGTQPTAQHLYAARAFDAFQLLAAAAADCKAQSGECLRQQLGKIKNYPGASNPITFDEFGDISTDFILLEVKADSFSTLN
jgi:branched-chain amino acid transport system substrate-binding protein